MKKMMYLHGFASSGASGTVELLRREFWEKAHEDRALCHGLFGGEDDDNRIRAMRKPRLALAGDSNAFLV